MNPLLLRIPQAAEALGISRSKLYQLIQERIIPLRHVGCVALIHRDDLERFANGLPCE